MTTPKGRIDVLADLARDPENGLVQLSGGSYWVWTYPEASAKPLVRIAIEMLDMWGIVDPEAAKAVLSWWSRYDELTPEDLAQLIDHYTSPSLMRDQIQHDGTELRD